MTKKQYSVRIDEHLVKYKTRIECGIDQILANDPKSAQLTFLSDLVNNGIYTGMLNCGPGLFDKLTIFRESGMWVAEMENVVEEFHENSNPASSKAGEGYR
jgi:hypothetical protein